jgi:ribosomal protein S27AE
MGWARVLERLLDLSPACPACGAATREVDEELVRTMPPVIEARYRCPRCAEEVVTCHVVDIVG